MLDKLLRKKTVENGPSISDRLTKVKSRTIPSHVAIIMDGNGRWARRRSLPRIAGHHEGMKTVRKITRIANDIGIKVLTLYAFSTENWKRPKMEIDFLMKLPGEFLTTYLPELIEQNVRVEMIGNFDDLPLHTKEAIVRAIDATSNNDGLVLNFAMNYGSRLEMVKAVKEIAQLAVNNQIAIDEIDESLIESHLMTSHLPEPDLLIRTSGEVRLSNFMLWQLAYSEFSFTEVLWPDFDESCMLSAIEEFQMRNRRFGSVEGIKEFETENYNCDCRIGHFFPLVIIGGSPFTIAIYIIASIGLYELLRMKDIRIFSFEGILVWVALAILLLPSKWTVEVQHWIGYTKIEMMFALILILLIYTVISKNKFTFDHAAFTAFSALYVGIGFYYLIETRFYGFEYVFYALLVIWTTDSGAYFIGRKIGKRKLWPEISPNKTVEGFVGGIVFAVLFACVFQIFYPIAPSYLMLIIVTIIASIVGQLGDLVESALKRHFGVKDSGNLLPGHGGILDRFDSLLFVLPLIHFLHLVG